MFLIRDGIKMSSANRVNRIEDQVAASVEWSKATEIASTF
jgi:hypothetical protein